MKQSFAQETLYNGYELRLFPFSFPLYAFSIISFLYSVSIYLILIFIIYIFISPARGTEVKKLESAISDLKSKLTVCSLGNEIRGRKNKEKKKKKRKRKMKMKMKRRKENETEVRN